MIFEPGRVFVDPGTVRSNDWTVVDVRSEDAFRTMGHVPGAVNVPFDAIRDPGSVTAGHLPDPDDLAQLLAEAGVAPDDTIVGCDGDRGVYAARFLLTAGVLGHEGDLRLLDGDVETWQADHPTETGPSDRQPTTYDPTPLANPPIADREAVEVGVDGDALLVDTRTAAEYEQSHIPGAVHLGWEELVDPEGRRLRPSGDLETLLADRGITPDREVILYCNTARRLSHTFAVLRELGYGDVRFYEGSLTDWVRASSSQWDPIALQERVRELAPGGFDAFVARSADDVLNRLKLAGLYHQKQEGYFMLRTKVPGGLLTAEQARVVGQVADEFARAPDRYGGAGQNPVFGDRFLDVTNRQDIQLHWIRLEDVPEIWDRYEAAGLTTLQACGNSVRNVVGCPAAGVDRNETIDPRPIIRRITERFLGDDRYGNLPRKFKVSVTGCHENCARAHLNDLGLTPAVKDGRDGFNVRIGGGLSDGPRLASDLDVFVEPNRVVPLVEATADVFLDLGSYLDTAVNRLRFLVEEIGEEAIREEIARRLDGDLPRAGESLTTTYRGDHVGVHPQSDGLRYVGCCVPTGRLLGRELARIGDLADEYGSGELRLTPNQNIILTDVPPERVADLHEERPLDRYAPDPGPFTRGIMTCTGREFCSYGIVETKSRAIRWARDLDAWAAAELADPPDVVRVHLSGCSASCAQPQIADIGLRGETYRDDRGEHEGVDIGLGGDLGRERFIDWLVTGEPIVATPNRIRALIGAFSASDADEFAGWVESTPDHRLQALVTGAGTAPPDGTAAVARGD